MLYLLGGAARSGKSIIARRILSEKNIPFFALDYQATGAAKSIPQLEIDLDQDDAGVGEKIWPFVKSVAKCILHNKGDYLLEGALLQPTYVDELRSEFPSRVIGCFTGYAEAEIHEKFRAVRQFGGGPDDWMMKFDDGIVMQELERLKEVNAQLKAECKIHNLRYFETSKDFEQSIAEVVRYLTTGARNGI